MHVWHEQNEMVRILNALKSTADEDSDDGFDPDDPHTCKICLDATVEVCCVFIEGERGEGKGVQFGWYLYNSKTTCT